MAGELGDGPLADLADRLTEAVGPSVRLNQPLAAHTTYRLGGPAAIFIEPRSEDELVAIARFLKQDPEIPVLILGRGSNVVVSDGGWPGVVLRLGDAFARIEEPTSDDLIAGAATPLPQLSNRATRRALTGLEFMIAIPGSVGGAVRMNAGAHGMETADVLVSARILDLGSATMEERASADLGLSYRRSNLTDRTVVVAARFGLERADPGHIKSRVEEYRRHRAETQPGALQNAGSVFKNPPGDHAGRIVDMAGLKGFRIGGARVADVHANFFMADAGSSAQDVYDLVSEVKKRVKDYFGIDLEPEIRFAGRFEPHNRGVETIVG